MVKEEEVMFLNHYIFCDNFVTFFPHLKRNCSYLQYIEILKMATTMTSGRGFYSEVLPEVQYNTRIDKHISYILSFWSTF